MFKRLIIIFLLSLLLSVSQLVTSYAGTNHIRELAKNKPQISFIISGSQAEEYARTMGR